MTDELLTPEEFEGRYGTTDAKRADSAKVQRPLIRIEAGKLPQIATAAERALIEAGAPIYRRGGVLVRPVIDEIGSADGGRIKVAALRVVEQVYMRDSLGRMADWQRYDKRCREWVPADAPLHVANTVLGRGGEWLFHPTVGVITTPTMRPDGSTLSSPGYDPATRLILMSPPEMPAIPADPSRDDALAELALLDGLIEEFPLVGEESRAVALSALLSPVARGAFPTVPLHATRSPVPGAGKSFLNDVAAVLATGQLCPVIAAGRSEEELEKRLGAALLAGGPILSIDNVEGHLGGAALCQAVERPVVYIRVLGYSELVRIESRTTLFATGNNLVLLGDMGRRALVATLDPLLERPELRQFTGNPVRTILADRGRFIAAVLTILRAYIVAGSPDQAPRLASFEGWSDTVRSALIWLGCADPVQTMEQARAEDPQFSLLRTALAEWSSSVGLGRETRLTAAEVVKLIEEISDAESGQPYDKSDREYRCPALREAISSIAMIRGQINNRTLGHWLARHKGRIADGLRFNGEGDNSGHAVKWWVESV